MTKRIMQLAIALAAFLAVAVLVSSPATAQAPTVNATLTEWSITTDISSIPEGESTWVATNNGTLPHEFLFLKTDRPVNDLPVGSDNKVNRLAEGIEDVGIIRSEDLVPGATVTEPFTLAAGNYALICNIPGHYSAGMRTAFTVTSDDPADDSEGEAQLPATGATGLSGSDGGSTGLRLAIGLAAFAVMALAAGATLSFWARRSYV